ncbi:Maf family protein [Methylomagnum ishizawai]|uniref:Maf family protein n=1 Tax=Methylomagnum ishizawai TaxID=1760988 RepID=UPI001C32474C|nr:Maf family protein [Methylomagnum ishizawai]BBL76633.1 Maf-like protein [Methylomagnum ishizawai]
MDPTTPRLILASASPRRRELLDQIGVAHTILPAAIPEIPRPGEPPEAYVRRIAAEKSLAVWEAQDSGLAVLAADTEVVLDGEIFGKPQDSDHAAWMLARLSGREHRVLSAVSLRAAGQHWEALSISTVAFRILMPAEIAAYWASGEPQGKAGAYAIQGRGARFIRHIAGSYSGVMGLPLFETAELLEKTGFG